MKRGWIFSMLVLVSLLAGCSAPTAAPVPTLAVENPAADGTEVVVSASGVVSASAEIVPLRSAELSFAALGAVAEIDVAEGEVVRAGAVLARQNTLEQLEVALQAAEKSVESAQKALDTLADNAPLALAEAKLAVTQAQKRYDDAVKVQRRTGYRRCDDDTIDLYFQKYEEAQDRLEDVREQNDGSMGALERVTEAQNVFDTAEANYRYCLSYTAQEIAESEAEMAVSDAGLKLATSTLEKLTASGGVDAQEEASLQAALASAQARLADAQAARDRAVILAPFDGVVTAVTASLGQTVSPGQLVVTLADTSVMHVETTDLSERDVWRVEIGQSARVSVDAFPGETYTAKVIGIAPRASKLGGDVVYRVTLEFETPPQGLLWGMSAMVEIGE